VRENRARLAGALGLGDPDRWWWLRQVHGAAVLDAAGPPPATVRAADAAVTATPGLPLAVLTADCAPLVLAGEDAVAVVHAGWVGLLAGVVEAAVARLRTRGRGPVRAALGPCIHPDRYAFGAADLARVAAAYGPAAAARTVEGEPALDLPAAVRAALAGAGVTDVHDVGVCTAGSPDHFSYRRDGDTGRQADAVAAGVRDVGENRAQELLVKAPALAAARPRWHFLGPLQRNKVRALAPWVTCWQTVDRPALGEAIARHAPGATVLVEVNLGREPQKAGCAPDATGGLVDTLRGLGLGVAGLMAVPPLDADPRPWFARLRDLASACGLPELSMGMTDDFEVAVEEGATLVRVGRALFGDRPRFPAPQR
jgi:YfiH family protein